jgi:hypothetical protein
MGQGQRPGLAAEGNALSTRPGGLVPAVPYPKIELHVHLEATVSPVRSEGEVPG